MQTETEPAWPTWAAAGLPLLVLIYPIPPHFLPAVLDYSVKSILKRYLFLKHNGSQRTENSLFTHSTARVQTHDLVLPIVSEILLL